MPRDKITDIHVESLMSKDTFKFGDANGTVIGQTQS